METNVQQKLKGNEVSLGSPESCDKVKEVHRPAVFHAFHIDFSQ